MSSLFPDKPGDPSPGSCVSLVSLCPTAWMRPRRTGRVIVKLQQGLARLLGVGGFGIQRSVWRRQRDRPGGRLRGTTADLPPAAAFRAVPSPVDAQAAEPPPGSRRRARKDVILDTTRRLRREVCPFGGTVPAHGPLASCDRPRGTRDQRRRRRRLAARWRQP